MRFIIFKRIYINIKLIINQVIIRIYFYICL